MKSLYTKLSNGTINKAFTHGSVFHADDVFSTALLQLINPEIEVTRGFEVPENFDGIVYDIGRGEFDHHQEDKEYRENGCPYAAFGLLWRELGAEFLGDEASAQSFDEKFVQLLDRHDNGLEHTTLSDTIAMFNPNWDEDCSPENRNRCFFEAVEIAKRILSLKREGVMSAKRASNIVEKALEEMYQNDSQICVLPQYAPWQALVIPTDAKYIVFPSARGGWNAQAVPVESGRFETKLPFPEIWRGKEKLELLCLQNGLTFCHPSGFLIATDTEEQAIEACKVALKGSEGNDR